MHGTYVSVGLSLYGAILRKKNGVDNNLATWVIDRTNDNSSSGLLTCTEVFVLCRDWPRNLPWIARLVVLTNYVS